MRNATRYDLRPAATRLPEQCVWVSQCDIKHIKNRPRKIKKELETDGKKVLKRKVRHSKRYKTDKSDRV